MSHGRSAASPESRSGEKMKFRRRVSCAVPFLELQPVQQPFSSDHTLPASSYCSGSAQHDFESPGITALSSATFWDFMFGELDETCELTVQRLLSGYGAEKQVSAGAMRGFTFSGPVSRRLEEEEEEEEGGQKDDAYGVQATAAFASF
ncbi:Hypothetical predicted protein [Xyrichtys novacula]|uniref:Uncharacterized protein n=1 Tax=Xyrichtys novacula TaxID=13765 RepID=A0AAV1EIX5_XYRNO|nr:Hypothetical predicted protein [Xyrichtys novacula]CAJ1048634.1 Hypothetical predicted protein [Xyrichtys novacula]CAJ1048638.1 Hypothetical predicted protein [Xyrichtys novacula]CAJ1048649.1 Hypothetical predicted protein [Xyrichtys novacula]